MTALSTPSAGGDTMLSNPPDAETIPAFYRAFVGRGADFVVVDGWTPRSQRIDIEWGVETGLLQPGQHQEFDQYSRVIFRLTDPGRRALASFKFSPPPGQPGGEQ